MTSKPHIIVVGCGPVGMVMVLALVKRGISVTALESLLEPIEDQRAATIQPPSMEMFDDLGIAEPIIPLGLMANLIQYHDRATREVIAEFDYNVLRDDTRFPFCLQYEQYKIVAWILDYLAGAPDLVIRFSTTVTNIAQSAHRVTVAVDNEAGEKELLTGDYVIGCDGGRSTVRKCAGIDFAGFTYPERFLKIATDFDFNSAGFDYCARNYFSDPDEWCNLFRLKGSGGAGVWRLLFPTRIGETDEECLSSAGMQARMQKFFPKDGNYPIVYTGLYDVHQRVAEVFRKGRILLAGDSAHVNNPIGGLGMNGGFHDAVNLADKLNRVLNGADDGLLDLYNRQRHKAQVDGIQAESIRKKKLMEAGEGDVRRRQFDELRRAAADRQRSVAYLRKLSLLDSLEQAESVT